MNLPQINQAQIEQFEQPYYAKPLSRWIRILIAAIWQVQK